jgi:hypothetical protein
MNSRNIVQKKMVAVRGEGRRQAGRGGRNGGGDGLEAGDDTKALDARVAKWWQSSGGRIVKK